MIKQGVIDENTPSDAPKTAAERGGGCCGGRCRPATAKQAADSDQARLSHPVTRAANAVTDAAKAKQA